jgi:23S rRNA (adenine2503-C2)-methyltransferase
MEPVSIKNLTLPEMERWVEGVGERAFRARQLYRHIYVRNVSDWSQCTDLGKPFRTLLGLGARLDAIETVRRDEAPDETAKYLFRLRDGNHIESVLIPEPPRYTLCLSSQVGCALGCKFCLTGSLGLKRNLDTAEIVDQVCHVQRDLGARARITNLVFMGMGEPLANYEAVVRAISILTDPGGLAFSHRRVTVSTAGLVPQLERLGRDSAVNLAISLHAPDDELRSGLMPVNGTYPLKDLMEACRRYPLAPRKRITFEYILLDGVNDSPANARSLVRLLAGVRAKVNLIPFNPHPGSPFRKPPDERVAAFQEVLLKARLAAIVRQSRGEEIGAACGQLVAGCELKTRYGLRDASCELQVPGAGH